MPAPIRLATRFSVSAFIYLATSSAAFSQNEPPECCRVPSRFGFLAKDAAGRVVVQPSGAGAKVLVDGELFAEYRTGEDRQPIVWPIYGPSGHAMTRSYPLGPLLPSEKPDHPHHQSLWFAHGDVNGHDFWHGAASSDEDRARVVHRKLLRRETNDGVGVIATANDWVAGSKIVLTDERTLRFGVLDTAPEQPQARYIDFSIRLIASHGPVTFGDTKEGTFAVRVPGSMKTEARLGGQIWNDAGQRGADAWGQPASWVAYSGPLEPIATDSAAPAVGGIVLMSSPENTPPRCRWHVRGYGLFAANPFGESDFPREKPAQGPVSLTEGDSLTLRYAAAFYAGEAQPEDVVRWYNALFDPTASAPLK